MFILHYLSASNNDSCLLWFQYLPHGTSTALQQVNGNGTAVDQHGMGTESDGHGVVVVPCEGGKQG